MAHWITSCEWCGKGLDFLTELKNKYWIRCDKCNDKAEKVILNDCYLDIVKSLKEGKWVIGEREIFGSNGAKELDFVVFVFLSTKGYIRATHSKENLKEAFNDLFSTVWNKEDIEKFGFNSLKEIEPKTYY